MGEMNKYTVVGTGDIQMLPDSSTVVEDTDYVVAIEADYSLQYEALVQTARDQGVVIRTPTNLWSVATYDTGVRTIFVAQFIHGESVPGAKERLISAARGVMRDGVIYRVEIGAPEGRAVISDVPDIISAAREGVQAAESYFDFGKWAIVGGLCLFGYALDRGWLWLGS